MRLPPEKWRILDNAHRKRNVAEYEGYLEIDQSLVDALMQVAAEVATRVASLGPVSATDSDTAG